jgi:glycosyltransferase involved in cell wall biosynthesis
MSRPLSIAHVTASFLPVVGGLEVAVHAIAERQAARGHAVTVFCPARFWWAMRRTVNFRLLPLPPRFGAMQMDAFRAGRPPSMIHAHWFTALQHVMGFDIWHLHMAMPTAFVAAPGIARTGAPWLITCHGADIQVDRRSGYGYRLIPGVEAAVIETLRRAPLVTAVSGSIRSEFESLGVDPARIRDVPNGISLDRITRLPADREAIRATLGAASDDVVMLTVGRNHPKKGFDLIPPALALLDRDKPWKFVLVGRGNDAIGRQLHELGLGERITVIAEIGTGASPGSSSFPSDALIALYKSADIFLFPTRIESFGIVTAEAMAAGLAVVTTDVPGSRDIVRHGFDGLLVPPDDPAALAGALGRLLDDPALRARLAREAIDSAASYDWPVVVDGYHACYEELVGTP